MHTEISQKIPTTLKQTSSSSYSTNAFLHNHFSVDLVYCDTDWKHDPCPSPWIVILYNVIIWRSTTGVDVISCDFVWFCVYSWWDSWCSQCYSPTHTHTLFYYIFRRKCVQHEFHRLFIYKMWKKKSNSTVIYAIANVLLRMGKCNFTNIYSR